MIYHYGKVKEGKPTGKLSKFFCANNMFAYILFHKSYKALADDLNFLLFNSTVDK